MKHSQCYTLYYKPLMVFGLQGLELRSVLKLFLILCDSSSTLIFLVFDK